jgi:hypothetical protein
VKRSFCDIDSYLCAWTSGKGFEAYYVNPSRGGNPYISVNGFTLNLMAGLVAYCLKENKPSLNLTDVERNAMAIA